ncbi:hypothetical protein BW41_03156 [Sphingomonas sp. RIT328]|nr:hypothetical protein BW41_03156 [Sphingomonas sp. RIT328]
MIDGQVAGGDPVGERRALAQRRDHAVDRVDEVLDLVVAGDDHMLVEVADRHRVERGADPLQAARHRGRDPYRSAAGQQHRDEADAEQQVARVGIEHVGRLIRVTHRRALPFDDRRDVAHQRLDQLLLLDLGQLRGLGILVVDAERADPLEHRLQRLPILRGLPPQRLVPVGCARFAGGEQSLELALPARRVGAIVGHDPLIGVQRQRLLVRQHIAEIGIHLSGGIELFRRSGDDRADRGVERVRPGYAEGDDDEQQYGKQRKGARQFHFQSCTHDIVPCLFGGRSAGHVARRIIPARAAALMPRGRNRRPRRRPRRG